MRSVFIFFVFVPCFSLLDSGVGFDFLGLFVILWDKVGTFIDNLDFYCVLWGLFVF